jgi:simple sugar transport system ATP-binding protein
LRNGKLVATLAAADADSGKLAHLMVGRDIAAPVAKPRAPRDVVCELRGVSVHGELHDVSLSLRGGEITAIAGVSGNGQQALAGVLFGTRAPDAGTVHVAGRVLAADPRDFVAAGVARVPEDRAGAGLIGPLPLWENAIAERYRERFARGLLVRRKAAHRYARDVLARFDVRAGQGIDTLARSLSGGNMQKLIVGRALAADLADRPPPVLIVASQPTWGLDVGAVAFVHQQIIDGCARGAAVLLICDDLDEIYALADRIAVIHAGRLTQTRPARDWDLAGIGLAMAGASAVLAADAASLPPQAAR